MSLMFQSPAYSSTSCQSDDALVKQLTELIRQNIPYSKRLDVLGILSYTTDNGLEKFIKIDSSFGVSSEDTANKSNAVDHCYSDDPKCYRLEETKSRTNSDIFKSSDNISTRLNHSPGASPPILPPSVIHVSRISRQEEKLDDTSSDCTLNNHYQNNLINNDNETNEVNILRRDRRKCRKPKRQIVDSDSHAGDSEIEDTGTDVEDSESACKVNGDERRAAKVPRIEPQNSPSIQISENYDETLAKVSMPTQNESSTNSFKLPSVSSTSNTVTFASPTAAGLSFVSLPYAAINKYLTPHISSIDVPVSMTNPLTTPPTKYAISTKSLGLSELGELCGVLPLNALLGKTLVSGSECSTTSKILLSNSTAPIPISGSDSNCQNVISPQISSTVISNTGTTQNILLNPNLAAAVAAAISNSSITLPNNGANQASFSSGLAPSLSNITTPSIALTGPSGELLGTIPITPGSNAQNLISSALGSSNVLNPSPLSTSLSSINVTMPITVSSASSPGLANTLNWLRYATNPAESTNNQMVNNVNSVNPVSSLSLSSGNPVALLHSLVTQQQQQQGFFQQVAQPQLQKQQPLSSTLSVGPTLALIGTLGLSSTSVTNSSSGTTSSETPTYTTSGSVVPQVTNLLNTNTNSVNANSTNTNGAALVAAALLRSLANVKPINSETPESTNTETNSTNIPGALTLITNNLSSSVNVVSSTRASIIGFDEPTVSLSNLLNTKPVSSNINVSFNNLAAVNTSAASIATRTITNSLVTTPHVSTTRNSIMLSYPRGTGEMNLLLAPASVNAFNPSSLTAVPTALSFQGLSNAQTTNLTFASPVLFQTPGASSVTQTSTVLSTITTSSTTSNEQNNLIKAEPGVNLHSTKVTTAEASTTVVSSTSDATASAIDRILQTIKGCMNASTNRDTEPCKIKPQKKLESKDEQTIVHESTGFSAKKHLTSSTMTTTKIAPISLRSNASHCDNDQSSDHHKISRPTTNERLPIPSLHKSTVGNDPNASEHNGPIPISKVYRCRYCGKTFNRKFCRERHERLHTGVKPYTCEICDEKFIRLEDKKRHVRSLQHYISGRLSSIGNENMDESPMEELLNCNLEPSSVLPLLAQTLQGGPAGELEPVPDTITTNVVTATTSTITNATCMQETDENDLKIGEKPESDTAHESPKKEANTLSPSSINNHNDESQTNADTDSESTNSNPREPSIDLLNNLRLATKTQHSLRYKCRTALKETQSSMNHVSETNQETGLKISTEVVVNNIQCIKSKAMGET